MSDLRGYINNFASTTDGVITAVATSITVDAVTGIQAELDLGADFVILTLDDTVGNIEVVHCTSVSGLILTVVRAQEGTTGFAFPDASKIECRLTAATVKEAPEWLPIEVRALTSSSATEDFNLLSANDYRLVASIIPVTNAVNLEILYGTGGGPTFQTATYYWSGVVKDHSVGESENRAANQAQIDFAQGLSNSAIVPIEFDFEINNPTASIRHSMLYVLRQSAKHWEGSAFRDVTEVMTAIRIQFSSGNIASGSKIILYRRSN